MLRTAGTVLWKDLRIEMLTKLLKHQNPYTKLAYAQDPALYAMLTRDLPTGNIGELKIEMRAKAGPERPNAAAASTL